MSADRRRRLDRFHSRQLAELRGRTQYAIARLNLGPTAKLLHMLTTLVDAQGASWQGMRALAEQLELSERWTRELFARACSDGFIQIIRRGGGRHRTHIYLLKIGAWRDNPHNPHMQDDFSKRVKGTLYAYEMWLDGLFMAHHQHEANCWQYAPARLKPSP